MMESIIGAALLTIFAGVLTAFWRTTNSRLDRLDRNKLNCELYEASQRTNAETLREIKADLAKLFEKIEEVRVEVAKK